jgi:hypothetical protein
LLLVGAEVKGRVFIINAWFFSHLVAALRTGEFITNAILDEEIVLAPIVDGIDFLAIFILPNEGVNLLDDIYFNAEIREDGINRYKCSYLQPILTKFGEISLGLEGHDDHIVDIKAKFIDTLLLFILIIIVKS